MTAILMYNHILTDPLIEFHELYFVLVRLLASCKRIDKMLAIRKEENTERCSVDKVELEEVGFAFDQRTILRNINLEFAKPCKKMIVGKTGSGKTTLVQIIAGLYPLQSGEVRYYYQGQRVQGKPRAICMMPDEYIFNMSIRDNILLFEKNVDEKRLAKILEITHLLDLARLKGDFPVGEGGKDLSMGEQKRLLVARAIYRGEYDLYIFDELTSSLDKTTAREILKNVIGFLDNKICIFIEHNVEFAGYMDEVIEISEGSIRQIRKN